MLKIFVLLGISHAVYIVCFFLRWISKIFNQYTPAQFFALLGPTMYYGVLFYTIWFVKYTWPTMRTRTMESELFEVWLIIESFIFVSWLFFGSIILLVCYLFRVRPFVRFDSIRDADNNPWNSMTTSDWLHHMQAEYFEINNAVLWMSLSLTPVATKCACGWMCFEEFWGPIKNTGIFLMYSNFFGFLVIFIGYVAAGSCRISLYSRRAMCFRIFAAVVQICVSS